MHRHAEDMGGWRLRRRNSLKPEAGSVINNNSGGKQESSDHVRDMMKSTGSHALGMWNKLKSFLGVAVAVNHLKCC